MSSASETEYDAAFKQGVAAGKPFDFNESERLILVPQGCGVIDLEQFLGVPNRIRQSVILNDVPSFVAYVSKFKMDCTLLVCDMDKKTVRAYLDYHSQDMASWNTHQATLQVQTSPEWKVWTSMDRRSFTQVQFAEFLEDNLIDVVEPDGAVLLEASMHLEAKKTVKFISGANLANGAAQLVYEESIEGKGKGNIVVPTRLKLGIPVFMGSDPVHVEARLRYRITEEKLTFIYILDRPADVLEIAFKDVVRQIANSVEITPLSGSLA